MKNLLILVSSIIIIFLFSGCIGFGTKEIEVTNKVIEKPKLNLSSTPIALKNINFIVITPNNSDEIWSKIENNEGLALIGLTPEDYEKLSYNTKVLKNLIIEQQSIIQKYKDYYENSK